MTSDRNPGRLGDSWVESAGILILLGGWAKLESLMKHYEGFQRCSRCLGYLFFPVVREGVDLL